MRGGEGSHLSLDYIMMYRPGKVHFSLIWFWGLELTNRGVGMCVCGGGKV